MLAQLVLGLLAQLDRMMVLLLMPSLCANARSEHLTLIICRSDISRTGGLLE